MGNPENVLAVFNSQVFHQRTLRGLLSESEWTELKQCLESGKLLTRALADRIASTMKEWALSKGATHFTHWFQPMTGATAEKHDSFLNWSGKDQKFSVDFTGRSLVKGESDASSFPNGGTRAAFEARGYTVWDMSSPAFIRKSVNGATLYIPTAFCSWTGDALDTKTPLLRSDAAINKVSKELTEFLEETNIQRAFSVVGAEQEFFLIDRTTYLERIDLLNSKRTVVGAAPIQAPEFRFHYFGETAPRVLAFMQETEIELAKLGVPILARHNEAAPGQFEMAPIYEPASLAADHNMLVMNLLQEVAHRHGFEALLHEKPFAGVNGSAKHLNYSISVTAESTGLTFNTFEPGETPMQNMRFMVFLVAMLRAIHLHSDLLRWVTLSPGNEHRLGGMEAPPASITVFLGEDLDEICRMIMGEEITRGQKSGILSLGVSAIPQLPRDTADRNRTSPIAFAGNRFEFRSVGASQSIALPLTVMNAILADSLSYMLALIKEKMSNKKTKPEAVQEAVKETLKKHYNIVYNGATFSEEYFAETKKRGIPNLIDPVLALQAINRPDNISVLERTAVFSRRELNARIQVTNEQYLGQLITEAGSQTHIVRTRILPAALKHQDRVCSSITAYINLKNSMVNIVGSKPIVPQLQNQSLTQGKDIPANNNNTDNFIIKHFEHVEDIRDHIEKLFELAGELESLLSEQKVSKNTSEEQFAYFHPKVTKLMNEIRIHCDSLEKKIDADLWTLPRYCEILTF